MIYLHFRLAIQKDIHMDRNKNKRLNFSGSLNYYFPNASLVFGGGERLFSLDTPFGCFMLFDHEDLNSS